MARPSNRRASTSAENRGNAHEEDEVRTELRIHTSGIVSHDSSSPRHSVAVHAADPSQYMSCPNALVGAGSASQNPEARHAAAILVGCATPVARNVMLSESQDEQVLSLEEQAARL